MSQLVNTLRPVLGTDEDFLLRVYASTRATELLLTGWDELACDAFVRMQFHAQTSHYQTQWPKSEHSVIEIMSMGSLRPAGRLWLDRRTNVIHVLDIALLPEWCGRGVGTACFKRLMADALRLGQAVTIQVEQNNPARRFYDRLGFEAVGPQYGIHQLMAWRSPAEATLTREEACDEQT